MLVYEISVRDDVCQISARRLQVNVSDSVAVIQHIIRSPWIDALRVPLVSSLVGALRHWRPGMVTALAPKLVLS